MEKNNLKNIINILILFSFIILSFITFYINNAYYYLSLLITLTLGFIIKKINIIDILKFNIYILFSFVLIIFIFNLIFMDLYSSLNILIKLILVCNLSFILSIYLPSYKLINTINLILKPLSYLKINTNSISLIITIGITFIPILINEITKIRTSLVAKGLKYNSISNIFNMIKILLPNLFKKINEIDNSLAAKGILE